MVQLENKGRSKTPPSHPIYGVYLSDEKIQAIVAAAFPHSKLLSSDQLPRGRSYNNRIYFLKVQLRDSSIQSSPQAVELVLKVNGRFFGANKVQNEVSSLWLLEHYCPEVLAPRTWAWSEDGETVIALSEDRRDVQKSTLQSSSAEGSTPGWILMSRAKGLTVSDLDLTPSEWAQIGSQVAGLAATWRERIPRLPMCGGICFGKEAVAGVELRPGPDPDRPLLQLKGIIGENLTLNHPVTNAVEYQTVKLSDKLEQLESSETYATNRSSLAPATRDFISNTLPLLDLTKAPSGNGNDGFYFTHFDLSPRNILVEKTDSGYSVTGVIDFEFSGFFPALEEFVNDYVDNGGDWPAAAYDAYLSRLAELGVATPAKGIDKKVWEQAHLLGQYLENIAPWWLPGDRNEKQLEEALQKARDTALRTLGLLQKSVV
ncbi:hypothetical protein GQ53DRAFT_749703 [Thozetella sp. PMI_491]|nr:hypothetical protein GQ53DRAFT_749703 [Thozetella sp. PMI_491]